MAASSRRHVNGGGSGPTERRRYHVALYSHDSMGLGHTRRNLLIAHALSSAESPSDILLVTGAAEANAFPLPPSVDVLSLPAIRKCDDGSYQSRRLALSLPELTALRAETIKAALLAFKPDLLIVDNVPRGAARELDPALAALRSIGATRIVLGLRDILDEPDVVAREWRRAGNIQALRAWYDAIWVYGDPRLYDTIRSYRFPGDIAARTTYVGYLDGRQRPAFSDIESDAAIAALGLPPGRLALCMVGGGQDGARVASAFVRAERPADMNAVVITGPFMPAETQRRILDATVGNPRLRAMDFAPEPTLLLNRADRVLTMGGYNSVGEVLAFEKPALVIPRVAPRREQWIRAEQLRRLGLVDVLHPDTVTPSLIGKWLASDQPASTNARARIDLGGLGRLPGLVDRMLAAPGPLAWEIDHQGGSQYVHVA